MIVEGSCLSLDQVIRNLAIIGSHFNHHQPEQELFIRSISENIPVYLCCASVVDPMEDTTCRNICLCLINSKSTRPGSSGVEQRTQCATDPNYAPFGKTDDVPTLLDLSEEDVQ